MKTNFKKPLFLIAILTVTISFFNCKQNSKKQQKEEPKLVSTKDVVNYNEPIVILTGYDKGNERYFSNAKTYFENNNINIVEHLLSIEEILNFLNSNAENKVFGDIHIVSKNNPFTTMQLETVVRGSKISAASLRKELNLGSLPKLKNVVNENTRIIFHSDALAVNDELVKTLRDVFSSAENPSIITTNYYSIFTSEFSNYYLAKPFYVFYPTANSPGKVDLSKEIAKKYPNENEIDWYEALNNDVERFVGDVYHKQFNIPVQWEFDFHHTDNEIPNFESDSDLIKWISENDEIMQEFTKIQIPLEKFRWTSKTKNNKLIIKGLSTCLVVLKPLIKPYGEPDFVTPDVNNKRLYAIN